MELGRSATLVLGTEERRLGQTVTIRQSAILSAVSARENLARERSKEEVIARATPLGCVLRGAPNVDAPARRCAQLCVHGTAARFEQTPIRSCCLRDRRLRSDLAGLLLYESICYACASIRPVRTAASQSCGLLEFLETANQQHCQPGQCAMPDHDTLALLFCNEEESSCSADARVEHTYIVKRVASRMEARNAPDHPRIFNLPRAQLHRTLHLYACGQILRLNSLKSQTFRFGFRVSDRFL